jgi:hypothetical protein
VLKRIASSGWTGRGRRAVRRVGLATYKSRARSTPSPLSWHLTESLRSVSPSEVGTPGIVQLRKAYDSGSWVFCRRRSEGVWPFKAP